MRIVLVATLALALAGCVSVGTNYSEVAVAQLEPGQSMRSVIAALGRPNAESVDQDGDTVLVWVHSTGSVFGAEARSLKLTFDKAGKLIAVPATRYPR